LKIRQHKN